MEVGGLFAVPTWHLFIRRNPGFILFIMPLWGPKKKARRDVLCDAVKNVCKAVKAV